MKLKTILAALLLSLIVCTAASAQAPFRDPGYKGSVGPSFFFFGPGVETVHGYMINSHHFIGGGVAGYFLPPITPIFKEFIHYQWYFKDDYSTPVAAAQLGLMQTWGIDEEGSFKNVVFFEPRFGWSWFLADRIGLTLTGGIGITAVAPTVTITAAIEL
jgi:hypothetical protein